MESCLVPIFAFLLLAVALSHAALTSELYWDSLYPNTPMPKAVRDLLPQHDLGEEKSTSVNVRKGGLVVDNSKPGKSGTHVTPLSFTRYGGVEFNKFRDAATEDQLHADPNILIYRDAATEDQLHADPNLFLYRDAATEDQLHADPNIFLYRDAATEDQLHADPNIFLYRDAATEDQLHADPNIFHYRYAATEDQLHADPNIVIFFIEKDLRAGRKMNLLFTTSTTRAVFLPRQMANAIPFSYDKLPIVMKQFSIDPQSVKAEAMRQTVQVCEATAQEGEEKTCATSLESILDFTTSQLGKGAESISTEVGKEQTPKQEYTIGPGGVKQMGGERAVVCHTQSYPYAVFYCHKTQSTKVYKVALVGADGTKATAAAVCHTDTSKWNPKHLAFQLLKVKPGTVPVCHFLPEDHIAWFSN